MKSENLTKLENPGYHVSLIKKGALGEISKIEEEVAELVDARQQNCKIMELVELSDLYGAIQFYLRARFPEISMQDLAKMSEITQRAFQSGNRK